MAALHWWEAQLTGLRPGESVELYSGRSTEPMIRLKANNTGSLRATLLTGPAAEGADEFALQRIEHRSGPGAMASDSSSREDAPRNGHAIRLTQILLGFRSRIETPTEVQGADLGQVLGDEILSVLRSGAVDIYEVSAPDRPVLIASYDQPDRTGTRIGRGRIFVWGSDGLAEVTTDPLSNRLYMRNLSLVPTLDVTLWQDRILVLDENGLAEVNDAGRLSSHRSMIGGRALAVLEEAVVVAGESAVEVFKIANLSEPVGRIEELRCEALFAETIGRTGSTLLARSSDGYVTIDVIQPNQPRLSGWHSSIPMLALAAGSGHTFACQSEDRLSLGVYTITGRRQR